MGLPPTKKKRFKGKLVRKSSQVFLEGRGGRTCGEIVWITSSGPIKRRNKLLSAVKTAVSKRREKGMRGGGDRKNARGGGTRRMREKSARITLKKGKW